MKKLWLSYSKVQSYIECPLKYRYLYIEKITQVENIHTTFGKALHESIATFSNLVKDEEQVTHSAIHERFTEVWDQEYKDGVLQTEEEKEYWIDRGRNFVLDYVRREGLREIKPILIEKPFFFDLNEEIGVRGVFDRVDYDESENPIIMEWKTNLKYKRSFLQLQMYALAYYTIYSVLPLECRFYSIENGESIVYVPTLEDLEVMKVFLVKIATEIQNEEFQAKPTLYNCRFCPAKKFCSFAKVRPGDK